MVRCSGTWEVRAASRKKKKKILFLVSRQKGK